MKSKILLMAFISIGISAYSQKEQCGTMQNLLEMEKLYPELKEDMRQIEIRNNQWIIDNHKQQIPYNPYKQTNLQFQKSILDVTSLCTYNNTYFTTINAPATLNQVVSPSPNCTYGGEYVTINGLVAGNTYEISTCSSVNFDTQLTIYTAGGGTAVAHNDDWCGAYSVIYFTPTTSGNYDILIDAYNCANNNSCATLDVKLFNVARQKVTIPVVVHVIHNGESIGSGKNISDNQIMSQLNVLNMDFRRFNSDINSTPAVFRGMSTDPLIEFCLAQRDEFGNPSTGINRYVGTQSTWDYNEIQTLVKPQTIWDRNKYLNLWVLEFGGGMSGTLGYAQFPTSGASNTDGVVIGYKYFGTNGTVVSPYNKGRTATHEVGHWLNLSHIWGNDGALCSGTDYVNDTPNQTKESFGVPSFPKTDSCSPAFPGVMFYNYMDYSDDVTLTMFTYGQSARMDAALFNQRASLLTSYGCIPTAISVKELQNNFVTIHPNPTSGLVKIQNKNSENIDILVYNEIGQLVKQSKENQLNIDLDLSDLNNGIYTVKIQNKNAVQIEKIIIVK